MPRGCLWSGQWFALAHLDMTAERWCRGESHRAGQSQLRIGSGFIRLSETCRSDATAHQTTCLHTHKRILSGPLCRVGGLESCRHPIPWAYTPTLTGASRISIDPRSGELMTYSYSLYARDPWIACCCEQRPLRLYIEGLLSGNHHRALHRVDFNQRCKISLISHHHAYIVQVSFRLMHAGIHWHELAMIQSR